MNPSTDGWRTATSPGDRLRWKHLQSLTDDTNCPVDATQSPQAQEITKTKHLSQFAGIVAVFG
ncbi:MAG TPA: hypothetical protein EYG03_00100 [Planctomycetes bacterium]|nr:hypothetical protein [Fuerstiella sp.]HIK90381.1 hypothetical protein [Planctomycetota bacterium]